MIGNFSKKMLASDCIGKQIIGAVLKPWSLALLIAAIAIPALYAIIGSRGCYTCNPTVFQITLLLSSICLLATVILVCNVLSDLFNLLRQEKNITNCQIAILCAWGLWILGIVFILDIGKVTLPTAVFGIIGSLLTLIFQDRIKGAVAFIHFRKRGLLNIGDWIKIPSLNVDGEIKKVTLTTVTLYNWDTTTSTIPINKLQSEHFMNLQNMCDGKTYGRQMKQTFTIDTSWIHPMKKEDIDLLESDKHNIMDFLPEKELKEGVLNIHLYRLYLYFWLMDNPHISQQPRLVVRWMDITDSGMALQVYAFIIDCSLPAFEWQKSLIIEHIIESMSWFGLRLYQSPSAYDAGNSNIFMADKPASYKIENL